MLEIEEDPRQFWLQITQPVSLANGGGQVDSGVMVVFQVKG